LFQSPEATWKASILALLFLLSSDARSAHIVTISRCSRDATNLKILTIRLWLPRIAVRKGVGPTEDNLNTKGFTIFVQIKDIYNELSDLAC
jgi:hypothetical protein